MRWWSVALVAWVLIGCVITLVFGWLAYVASDAYREDDRPWRR